jgi:MscS family membrane protein
LRYETSPDQIRYILVEVRRLLYAHPKVDSSSARIRFVGFGSSSLDLEVFSYITVTPVLEYLEVAEDLNLRIMDIVAAAGSSFAFPSQTTYIEKGAGLDADRARAAEVQVQDWRERGELFLPRFPSEKIAEIDNTLVYPPDGSATSIGPGR